MVLLYFEEETAVIGHQQSRARNPTPRRPLLVRPRAAARHNRARVHAPASNSRRARSNPHTRGVPRERRTTARARGVRRVCDPSLASRFPPPPAEGRPPRASGGAAPCPPASRANSARADAPSRWTKKRKRSRSRTRRRRARSRAATTAIVVVAADARFRLLRSLARSEIARSIVVASRPLDADASSSVSSTPRVPSPPARRSSSRTT